MATTTVTATYLKPNGDPATGRVTFELVAATYHDGLDAIFPITPVTGVLVAGELSVELEPTSGVDADFDATDMTYQVTERVTGAKRDAYYVDIPTAPSVDLGTLATYDDPPGSVRELVTPDLSTLGFASDAALAAVDAAKVPITQTQAAEITMVPVFKVTPATAGQPAFELRYQSYANAGGGAGTYNHAAFLGYNTGRHATGSVTASKPALIMGMEDNYFDSAGSGFYGPEWYVEYWSGDGTTWQGFRPFYTRIEEPSAANVSAAIHFDIGNHANGAFTVLTDFQHLSPAAAKLFEITKLSVTSNVQLNMTKNISATIASAGQITLTSAAGQSIFTIDSPSPATVLFKVSGSAAWYLSNADVNTLNILNKSAATHVSFVYGATASVANTIIQSHMDVYGGVRARGSVAAASTDRLAIGMIDSLTASQDGAYVGWANGVAGTSAGDLVLIPRSSAGGIIRAFAGSGTPVLVHSTYSGGMVFGEGKELQFGTTTGSKIGATSTDKIAFWGTTPIVRPTSTPAAASDPATTMALVNDLRTKLLAIGLVA